MFFSFLAKLGKSHLRQRVRSARKTRVRCSRLESLEERRVMWAGQLDPAFAAAGTFQLDPRQTLEAMPHPAMYQNWGAGNATQVVVQSDGKILQLSKYSGYQNGGSSLVTRLNSDGSLDTTFGVNGSVAVNIGQHINPLITADLGPYLSDDIPVQMAVQSDGKIVVGVTTDLHNSAGTYNDFGVFRLNTDGSLDNSFSGDGIATVDFTTWDSLTTLNITPSGKILLTGIAPDYLFSTVLFARFSANGYLDTSFDGDGKLMYQNNLLYGIADTRNPSPPLKAAVDNNNGILLSTHIYSQGDDGYGIFRFNSNGSLDTNFKDNLPARIWNFPSAAPGVSRLNGFGIADLTLLPGGKILAVSQYENNTYDPKTFHPLNYDTIKLTRLNADGTSDNSYGTNGEVTIQQLEDPSDQINKRGETDVTRLGNGQLLVSSIRTGYNRGAAGELPNVLQRVRINADGTLDTTYDFDGTLRIALPNIYATSSDHFDFAWQYDGKFLLLYSNPYAAYAGNSASVLLRYREEGNDQPVIENNRSSKTYVGGTDVIRTVELGIKDDNLHTDLAFTVTVPPTKGHLELLAAPGVAITKFTQDDIDNNRLIYKHTAANAGNDNFTFTVSDGHGGSLAATKFYLAVAADNVPPVITNNAGVAIVDISVPEGIVHLGDLTGTDFETSDLQFSVTGPDAGFFRINANPQAKAVAKTSLDFNVGRDYETSKDVNHDNVYEVLVHLKDTGGKEATQLWRITITDATMTATIDSPLGAGITLHDVDQRNDKMLISRFGNYIVLTDTTGDPNVKIVTPGIPGVLGEGTNSVSIPLYYAPNQQRSITLDTNTGDDQITIDTNKNANDKTAWKIGYNFELSVGAGNDSLSLLDNPTITNNDWNLGYGYVNLGNASFLWRNVGLEKIVSNSSPDTFDLTYSDAAKVCLTSIDAGANNSGVSKFTVASAQGMTLNGTTVTFSGGKVLPFLHVDSASLISNGSIDARQSSVPVTLRGANTLYGSPFDDNIQGSDGNDNIYGGGGNDFIYGGKGDDNIHGGAGNDSLYGGSGNDKLYGELGSDLLVGSLGNDLLIGGYGNDVLIGGKGADQLNDDTIAFIDAGDDLLIASSTTWEDNENPDWNDANVGDLDKYYYHDLFMVWSGPGAYAERITKLNQTGFGDKNQYKLDASTVLDDAAVDILFDGPGTDWYFAKNSDPNKDVFTLGNGEQAVSL